MKSRGSEVGLELLSSRNELEAPSSLGASQFLDLRCTQDRE